MMLITLVVLDVDYGPMKTHEDNALNGDLFTTDDRSFVVEEANVNKRGSVLDLNYTNCSINSLLCNWYDL